MAIKPILFNTEMVRAILGGRKTCTRRLPNKRVVEDYFSYEAWAMSVATDGCKKKTEKQFYEQYPPYQTGDILYVRETFYMDENCILYKADNENLTGYRNMSGEDISVKWRPSIYMPKEAARIWLKVTDVRVERLQEITDKDAEQEGAQPDNPFDYDVDKWANLEHFKEIWNSTIKKSDRERYGWDANPYVLVIEFERCEKPEDA